MFVDEALGRRLETVEAHFAARIAEAFAAAEPAGGAGFLALGGAVAPWVAPHSVLSKVYALGLDGAVADGDLDAIEAFYRAHGDRRVQVELSPFAGVELAARLEDRGYRLAGHEQVQVRVLTAPDRELEVSLAPGVTVETVDPADAATRATWARVSSDGFFAPGPSPPDIVRYSTLCFDVPGTVAWLARVDGAPAGGGAFAVHDGIAPFFAGSTLPAFRRRGSHHALIAARLRAAARAGAKVATVGARAGSESHRHLDAAGFTVAYTRWLFVRSWE